MSSDETAAVAELSVDVLDAAMALEAHARYARTPEVFARVTADIAYTIRALANALESAGEGFYEDVPREPFDNSACWPVMFENGETGDEAAIWVEETTTETAEKLHGLADEVMHPHFVAHGWLGRRSPVASPVALDLGSPTEGGES